MALTAYCAQCGRYVELSGAGECPNGHPRSALRDVREDRVLPAETRMRSGAAGPVSGAESYTDYNSVLAQVLGKSIVIIPVALIIAFGIWTGY